MNMIMFWDLRHAKQDCISFSPALMPKLSQGSPRLEPYDHFWYNMFMHACIEHILKKVSKIKFGNFRLDLGGINHQGNPNENMGY